MKEYKSSVKLSRVRLSKKDIEDLVLLAEESFPKKKADRRISIRVETGNATIQEDSLEDVFSQNLPNRLYNFSFSINQFNSNFHIIKRVGIYFSDYSNSVDVSGSSETWVNGKAQQVKEFLDTKRSKFSFVLSGYTAFIIALLAIVSYLCVIGLKLTVPASFIFLAVDLIASVYLVIYSLTNIFPKKIYPTFVLTTQEEGEGSNRENLNVIMGILALIFTAAGVVIGIIALFKQ